MSVLRSAIVGGRRPAGGASEPVPVMTIADVSLAEGQSGSTAFVFTLNVDRKGSTRALAFSWSVAGTGPDPANAADFAGPMSGSGTIAANVSAATITVLVAGDVTLEQTERFALTLTANALVPLVGVTAIGTIVNDDAASGVLDFSGAQQSGLATLFMEDF